MGSDEEIEPGIGDLAKDAAKDRVGLVMGKVGGRVQMRPVDGGLEWDAMPENVRRPSAREELSARLAVRNGMTRSGL
ncbi:hypothetical protein [Streptomyces sp. NPDC002889]|uniref:hypothetical protein n=1 Tax=Streptomyces sp. NPDC002889 TaxID=3364669 RepID=UPI003681382A